MPRRSADSCNEAPATPAVQADRRPNIVVVLVDDMGWSDIGSWDAWARCANVDSWDGPRRLSWGDDAPPAKPFAR